MDNGCHIICNGSFNLGVIEMNNYIDIYTGWHAALATWGFFLAEKWIAPLMPAIDKLKIAAATVIVGALIYELIFDVLRQKVSIRFGWKPPYASMERCLVNSFFDMVAAFLAIAACLVIESIG